MQLSVVCLFHQPKIPERTLVHGQVHVQGSTTGGNWHTGLGGLGDIYVQAKAGDAVICSMPLSSTEISSVYIGLGDIRKFRRRLWVGIPGLVIWRILVINSLYMTQPIVSVSFYAIDCCRWYIDPCRFPHLRADIGQESARRELGGYWSENLSRWHTQFLAYPFYNNCKRCGP